MHIAIAIAFTLLGLASSQTFIDECKPCRLENCPPLQEPCLSGVVKDSCNCCTQCGRLENEKCDNETLPLPSRHQYGLCGENLICALRKDLKAGDAEALCTCKEPGMVCGNDARTYATVCNMREVAAKSNNENLFMQDWGPCKSFPIIVSGPENVTEHIKESVALSCEVKGFPVPTITWEVETSTGKKLNLPSDDPAMAVQVRGGPEPFMITSWVQIMELRPTDSGTYTCVAKNSEGEVRASAQLGVNKA